MKEKIVSNTYSSNENVINDFRGVTHDGSYNLTSTEILILECTKSKAKSEPKISREVKINLPIVSQVITDLMFKGLIERTIRRRILSGKEYFSTNIEGLIALEQSRAKAKKYTFFWQVISNMKDHSQSILADFTSTSITLKLILGTAKLMYRMVRYMLSE
jgi:DNA-binding MarR family transcriptional regulator